MDVSIFAFEQQVSLIRQELFKKGGLLSKPTPPSAEELQAGLDAALGRIDYLVFPRLSASRVVRYFYGARLRDGGSKLSSVSTSFALAALTMPELVTSPRVFALSNPGFPRWRCVFLTVAVKYDIKINAVLTI